MFRSIVRVMLTGVCAVACVEGSDLTAAESVAENRTGEVLAARVSGGVRVTNSTASPVPYAVWDRGFLGLLANPCDGCNRLSPGESVTVREGIDGFAGFGDAVVYWWDLKDPLVVNTVIVTGGKPYPVDPTVPDTTSRDP